MHLAKVAFTAALAAVLLLPADGVAADVKGSKDHPLVSRYEGAAITRYGQVEFDEYALVLGKYKGREIGDHQTVEGRVTKIIYEIDKSRTTLEVFRNYQTALTGAGFQVLFTCKDKECGSRDFGYGVHGGILGGSPKGQRFLAAKLVRPEGTAYVSLYIKKAYEIGGAKQNTVYVGLDVIESKEMETDKVTVDAEAMAKGIEAEGHIAIYGVYFDTGSDKVKAESAEALAEIAKLLAAKPELKLLVVGHTDNQGKLAYNMDLSRRRAASVVAALVEQHGIAAARLTPGGVGFLAPVASNRGEAGRTLNRRVELVER